MYRGYADERAEVLRVQRLECFEPAPLPDGVRRDKPSRCSVTTLKLAARLSLTRVRGYALFPPSPETAERTNESRTPAWFGHWWAVTLDGHVVDASWAQPGLAHVGERIAFRKESSSHGGFDLMAETLEGETSRISASTSVRRQWLSKRSSASFASAGRRV